MRKSSNRSLRRALLASVAAHAVLLASLPDPAPAPGALGGRRIDARLVARPAAPSMPAAATAATAVGDQVPNAAGSALAAVRQPAADSPRRRDELRSGRGTPPLGRSPVRSAPRAPDRLPAGGTGNDGVPEAVAAESTAFDPVSAAAMRQYRVDLAVSARRFNAYPELARTRGWQGTAEVVLQADARSPEPRAVLWRSSGHAVLDAQAVDTLARAARATPLPAALAARALHVVVAIRFDLDDER